MLIMIGYVGRMLLKSPVPLLAPERNVLDAARQSIQLRGYGSIFYYLNYLSAVLSVLYLTTCYQFFIHHLYRYNVFEKKNIYVESYIHENCNCCISKLDAQLLMIDNSI